MDTQWDEEVAGLLTDLSSTQSRLLEVLAEKRELLLSANHEGLATIADREREIIGELEACSDRRKALLGQAEEQGLPSDSLRSLAAVIPAKDQKQLVGQFHQAATQTRILQHQSLANWVLVQRSIVHLSQLLEIIATGGRSKPTYGKGETSGSNGSLIDQEVVFTPAPTQKVGNLLFGLGVDVQGVVQKVDKFLEERLRTASSDRANSEAKENTWFQLEGLIGELSDTDLSTALNDFISSINEVLNQPESVSVRNLAVLQGQTLTAQINRLSSRTTELRVDLNDRVEGSVQDINRLIGEIRELNQRITETEGGNTSASDAVGLRDKRGVALTELSELISIQVVEQASGAVNVYSGSDFLVFEGTTRQVQATEVNDRGLTVSQLSIKETGTPLDLSSGKVGGYVSGRDEILGNFQDQLNEFTSTFIYEFNRVFSSGQGLTGYQSLTSEFGVDDVDAALDAAGLEFTPENGSFEVQIFNRQTGLTETSDVFVNLDGLDDDTSLSDLAAALDAIDGLSATIDTANRLQITSDTPDQDFAFSNDTSGVLAALGLNTFFKGTAAGDVGVSQVLAADPGKFAASANGIGTDTTNAVQLAGFLDRPLETANGTTITDLYDRLSGETTQNAAVARAVADGFRVFEQTLQGDHLAISGVSIDEETVRMISYQRVFQAAARYISELSDLLDLLNTIATGRRVVVPSDDAPAALRGISIQRLLERKEQVRINLQTNNSYLSATDTALSDVSSLLASTRATAVSVVGTTSTDTQRESAAIEVDRLIQQLIDVSNQSFRGRTLFSGSNTTGVSFKSSGNGVVYEGNEQNIFSYSDIDVLFETNLHGVEVFGGLSPEVVGIADLNPVVTASTRLSDLRNGAGISKGDVVRLLEANPPQGRSVEASITATGINVELDSAGGGGLTLKEVAGGTTVAELGLLTEVGTGTGPVVGKDINPQLTGTTRLSNILGVRAKGQVTSQGSRNDLVIEANDRGDEFNDVTITYVDGGPLTFGLETAVYDDSDPNNKTLTVTIAHNKSTASQVLTAINNQTPFTASLDPNELENDGSGKVQATAIDTSATGVTAGGSGIEFDQTSGIQITNGGNVHDISFTSAETIEDLLNILNGSSAQVLAELSSDGSGISIRSRLSGSDFSIGENGGTTATELGIRSLNTTTRLEDLDYGRGVHTVDDAEFTIIRNDGVELAIDLDGAATIGDVLDLINNHVDNPPGAGHLTADFVEVGNGIRLVDDNPDGTNVLSIRRENFSEAAWDLGLIPHGQDTSDPPVAAVAATATTVFPGANNDLLFTATDPGTIGNDFPISFVDTGGGPGSENVTFTTSPKGLVFGIDPGTTTAADIITLLENHPQASQRFTAELVPGDGSPNDGSNLITDLTVTATTADGTPEILNGTDTNPSEATGVFNALLRLRDALRDNNTQDIERSIELLDTANLQVNFSRADLGSRQQALEALGLRLADEEIELRSSLSLEIDADLTEAITDYTAKQVAFQASLQTTAQIQSLTSPPMTDFSRRRFLEQSMFAATAALTTSASSRLLAAEEARPSSPNEKYSVAIIGTNGRGQSHIGSVLGKENCEITYLCDPDSNVGQRRTEYVAEKQGKAPNFVQDMRRVFEDDSVDIVTIATQNHWHALAAIWAMQAGKDVYVEKPVSHNVSEGRRMVQVARKEGRICQTGTQIRSNRGTQEAIDFIHSGGIGDVKVARGTCYKRRNSIGHASQRDVPSGVDYNLWLGPAPERPFTKNRFHYNWHWHWDYGNGDLGNQGIHQMDVARWGLGLDNLGKSVTAYGGRFGYEDDGETPNTMVSMHDYGDKMLIFEVRGLKTDSLRGANVGNVFYGSDGYVVMTGYATGAAFDLDGKMIKQFDGGGDHFGNFLDAVASRKHEDLNADIEEGHLSSALCHLGNNSFLLGEEMSTDAANERLGSNEEVQDSFTRFKDHLANNSVDLSVEKLQLGPQLMIDTANEEFINNGDASAMLTRNYRKPFVVPSESDI
ncbi:unnamed protein product [Cladocopium goreaui]|uniref:Flagellar hook-associated protein 1 (HAP1) n=1 Tax=Cladocopium goreaui TaxID=2562237 RepID=A0A9P1BDP9_9DINO|nr:unnamed protein product [Cladocopium goreaui]